MDSSLDWFWLMLWWFFFVFYIILLFQIVADLFRDRSLNGWWKALWIVGLIVVPYLSALIYVIARGNGMAERHRLSAEISRQATDEYIRAAAGSSATPASEIADAKALYDTGAITAEEFAQLKAKALA